MLRNKPALAVLMLFLLVALALPAPSVQGQDAVVYLPVVLGSEASQKAPDPSPDPPPSVTPDPTGEPGPFATVFVSRQIPPDGSVYWDEPNSLPGVGPYSRFQVAAPSSLIIREADGTLWTLIDGSQPSPASLNLIDVSAPDVSYDGTQIVFAGLPAGTYSRRPMNNPGAWRIYRVNVDGSGLKQITFSDRDKLDLSQFGENASHFATYDDTDPAWLPDGRIVFSSTRWPSHGMYGAARTSNLYVVDADGSDLHRITSERNGADRPMIDPVTGKIVYSRWWRNFRTATNSMAPVPDPAGGYQMRDGLLSLNHSGRTGEEVGGTWNLNRNAWHLATINPDGTGLAQWGGQSNTQHDGQIANMAYGGAFAADGTLYANFFPMTNGTEASGFGGIRHFTRGPNGSTPIIGITSMTEEYVHTNPNSYGVFVGAYSAEPEVLDDGTLLISWTSDHLQDYGLYTVKPDGSELTLYYDNPGTSELRARVIRQRPLPPIIPDRLTKVASPLPPLAEGPYDADGTFTFEALNVYFNAPVDSNIVNAMPVGSAGTIRFFIDHQRDQQTGSFETLDWPILLQELAVSPDGSLTATSPANVPLFEQIRSPKPVYEVPLTGRGTDQGGAAHVAGENFGRPDEVQRCVGCHAGHTMIPVPDNPEDAQWSNLAPGAMITSSSLDAYLSSSSVGNGGLVDRRVHAPKSIRGSAYNKYWLSASDVDPDRQWVQLTFPVPVSVRIVRPYNLPAADSNVKVQNTTIKLYSDKAATQEVASKESGPLSEWGSDVPFDDVSASVVRIEMKSVTGNTAGLAEVEIIARGESAP